MNFITSILLILAAALIPLSASALARAKNWKTDIPRKAVAGVLTIACFIRYMKADEAFKAMGTQGLNMWSPFGSDIASTVLSAVLIWFTFSVILTAVMDAFFETRILRHMSLFFGVPVLIIDTCFFTTYVTGVVGASPYATGDIRIPLMAVEIGLTLALILSRVIEESRGILPTLKEVRRCLLVLPAALISIIPSYTPWVLVGNAFTPASMELPIKWAECIH